MPSITLRLCFLCSSILRHSVFQPTESFPMIFQRSNRPPKLHKFSCNPLERTLEFCASQCVLRNLFDATFSATTNSPSGKSSNRGDGVSVAFRDIAPRASKSAFHAALYATFGVWFESVAQLVEHRPFKALVLGSSPSALTIPNPSLSCTLGAP